MCAVRGCPKWHYFQVHYIIEGLILGEPSYRAAVDALLALSADEHKPGPHLYWIDYNDTDTYLYKRPKFNVSEYVSFVNETATKFAASGVKPAELPFDRKIYYMWLQGEEELAKKNPYNEISHQAWLTLNPTWEMVFLTNDNLAEYAPLTAAFWEKSEFVETGRKPSHLSDLARFEIMCTSGGVWTDASVMPMTPLDSYLAKELEVPGREFLMYRFTKPHGL